MTAPAFRYEQNVTAFVAFDGLKVWVKSPPNGTLSARRSPTVADQLMTSYDKVTSLPHVLSVSQYPSIEN